MRRSVPVGAFPAIVPALHGFQWEQEFGSSIGFLGLDGDWQVFLQVLQLWLCTSVIEGVKSQLSGLKMGHWRLDLEFHFAGELITGSYQPATLI